MKRPILFVMMLALVMAVTTGCVQYKTNVTLNTNGSIDLTQKVGYSKALDSLGNTSDMDKSLKETVKEAKDKGFTAEKYSNDQYKGVILKEHFADLNAFQKAQKQSDAVDDTLKGLKLNVHKGFFKTTYNVKGNIDLTGADADTQMALSNADLTFSITLPSKAISNNAYEVKGNTYTWKLTPNEKIDIALTAEKTNTLHYAYIGCGILLVVIALILLVRRRSSY